MNPQIEPNEDDNKPLPPVTWKEFLQETGKELWNERSLFLSNRQHRQLIVGICLMIVVAIGYGVIELWKLVAD